MRRWAWVALVLAGCSDIAGTKGGVVALDVVLPAPAAIETNDTLTLTARAFDGNGNLVNDAVIVWATPDTAFTLDSLTGKASTTLAAGSLRVQAHTGSLFSDLALLEVHRRSDTLRLTDSVSLTVPTTDSASGALVAAVQSLTPDTAGITNTRILFEVVDTAAARGKVHFAGNVLALRVATGGDGKPAAPVSLRRGSGSAGLTVQVRVSATRPSGAVVPGSGQLLSVNFQ
ncbi:MAG: hypothetical protein U0133_07220 [Gemmatimonadales bacterium]